MKLISDCCIQGFEEGAGFGENIFGFGGGERPAEGALRGELGSAFGVAADELHQRGGIDGGFGESARRLALTAANLTWSISTKVLMGVF